MTALGIIAGAGDLPIAIADCALSSGRSVFVAALQGIADPQVCRLPHQWVSLGQTGRMLALLRQNDCRDVLLAGKVSRPKWKDIRFDSKALSKLPQVMAAAARGDDALLRSFVKILEEEGFRVIGAAEAAPGILAPEGVLGAHRPCARDRADLVAGIRIVRALGACDVGQAAVVSDGVVLAVEAAEGTDAMLSRIPALPEAVRGAPGKGRGVLVKMRKPIQDGKTDLPVIGPQTIRSAAAAYLSGIAVEAGAALILNRRALIEAADKAGLFVLGFSSAASA